MAVRVARGSGGSCFGAIGSNRDPPRSSGSSTLACAHQRTPGGTIALLLCMEPFHKLRAAGPPSHGLTLLNWGNSLL
jgi:hypothetical protein